MTRATSSEEVFFFQTNHCVVIIQECRLTIKLRTIVVPVTTTFLIFSLKFAPSQKSKGLIGSSSSNSGCIADDLVKDLLTELVEEHLTLVVRIGRILHHIDVGVVGEFMFLFTCNLLSDSIPEFQSWELYSDTGSF